MIYMALCFIHNRESIKTLVSELHDFEKYGTKQQMIETEKRASLYSKIFIIYGVLGNLFYLAVPYIDLDSCIKKKLSVKYSRDIPCGLITRFRVPFKYDEPQLFYPAIAIQLFACLMTTIIVLAITMFLIALLMQIITQLKQLRYMLSTLCNNSKDDVNAIKRKLKKCIEYHILINK